MKSKLLKNYLAIFFMLFTFASVSAHVWEIRVNQNQDGSLTWYLQSYHSAYERGCTIGNSGLVINGVRYYTQSKHSGSITGLSPTVFAVNGNRSRNSYAVLTTPFLGTSLSVYPFSDNVCWANLVHGTGNFTTTPTTSLYHFTN